MSHAALKNDRHYTLLDVQSCIIHAIKFVYLIVVVLPIYSFKTYKSTLSVYRHVQNMAGVPQHLIQHP